MKRKFVIPVRETCFMIALALRIIDRTLIEGISWIPAFSGIMGILYSLVDLLFVFFLAASLIVDLREGSGLFHMIGAAVLFLLAIPARKTGEVILIYSAGMIFVSRNLHFDHILEVFYKTALFSILILILANVLHWTVSQEIVFENDEISNSVGMAHPNNFAAAVAVVTLLWSYRNREKPLRLIAAVIWAVALIIRAVTISRTVYYILLAYPCVLFAYRLLERINGRRLARLIPLAFVLIFAVAVYLMLHGNEVAASGLMDKNLASRFFSALNIYNQYGIHFFGSPIRYISMEMAARLGQDALILDSAYLFAFLSQGIVATAIIVLCFFRCMYVMINKRKYRLLLIFSMFMLIGITERYMLDASMNFVLLATFALHDDGESSISGRKKKAFQIRRKPF